MVLDADGGVERYGTLAVRDGQAGCMPRGGRGVGRFGAPAGLCRVCGLAVGPRMRCGTSLLRVSFSCGVGMAVPNALGPCATNGTRARLRAAGEVVVTAAVLPCGAVDYGVVSEAPVAFSRTRKAVH